MPINIGGETINQPPIGNKKIGIGVGRNCLLHAHGGYTNVFVRTEYIGGSDYLTLDFTMNASASFPNSIRV
jgi:hypothetical protein